MLNGNNSINNICHFISSPRRCQHRRHSLTSQILFSHPSQIPLGHQRQRIAQSAVEGFIASVQFPVEATAGLALG